MSKNSFGLMFSIAFILCAFLSISAQENTFKEEDLTALKEAAELKLEDRTHRQTTTIASYSNGSEKPTSSIKTIWETIPPDRLRLMSISETAKGVKRLDYIRVGERRFSKEDDGEWKELTTGGIGNGSGSGDGSVEYKLEKTFERKLRKGEIVNKQKVDTYEMLTTYTYIYPTKTFTKVWKEIYSFDAKGMFVKFEEDYNNGEENLIRRTVKEYEYDPKIKIEVPILSKPTK